MFKIKYINRKNKNIINILNDNIKIHKKLYDENNIYKKKIDDIPYDKWKIIRSISNDYEIIGNNKIHNNYEIKKHISVSRAYYKLLEILNIFENTLKIKKQKNMTFSCLCEAPGGFIKCLHDYRKNNDDFFYTISKKDDKYNKIDWNIKNIKNLNILYGEKDYNNGDIYNPKIINYYINKHKKKVDLVTADGGLLLNNEEENYKSIYHIQLYLCQIYIALNILKLDGIFILKIYDITQKVTLDIIILLNYYFDNVKIIKPKTSREMNNEKYIICYKKNNNNSNLIKIYKIIKKLWEDKNLLLINLLTDNSYNDNSYLIKTLSKIEYKNLIRQNIKLKQAIYLKDNDKNDLKILLKEKKRLHFNYAYKWLKLNKLIE